MKIEVSEVLELRDALNTVYEKGRQDVLATHSPMMDALMESKEVLRVVGLFAKHRRDLTEPTHEWLHRHLCFLIGEPKKREVK